MTGILVTSPAPTDDSAVGAEASSSAQQRARNRLTWHAELWRDRPLLRQIYRGYHQAILGARSEVRGVNVEIGAGHGSLAEFSADVILCDIVRCPWLDCAADAVHLPFRDGSLANIIMVDVLHHLADPRRFFTEAHRALAPGGRVVVLEPYVSAVSSIAWRSFDDEDCDMKANPLGEPAVTGEVRAKDPWDANIAIPTLLFWRDLNLFQSLFPDLSVIRRDRFDLLLYPLSGGFERRRLVPLALVPLVRAIERLLSPLAALLAFRCLVVIEKAKP